MELIKYRYSDAITMRDKINETLFSNNLNHVNAHLCPAILPTNKDEQNQWAYFFTNAHLSEQQKKNNDLKKLIPNPTDVYKKHIDKPYTIVITMDVKTVGVRGNLDESLKVSFLHQFINDNKAKFPLEWEIISKSINNSN